MLWSARAEDSGRRIELVTVTVTVTGEPIPARLSADRSAHISGIMNRPSGDEAEIMRRRAPTPRPASNGCATVTEPLQVGQSAAQLSPRTGRTTSVPSR